MANEPEQEERAETNADVLRDIRYHTAWTHEWVKGIGIIVAIVFVYAVWHWWFHI